MEFEKLLKRNAGLAVAPTAVVNETMSNYPVIANTSGLREGEVVMEILDAKVVIPTIRGEKRAATVVLMAKVIGTDGVAAERLVFLSTLIRKIDLNAPYKGLIAEHKDLKDHAEFTNQQWVDGFKKAAPFRIDGIETIDREVNIPTATSQTSTIKVKELALSGMTKAEAEKLITA